MKSMARSVAGTGAINDKSDAVGGSGVLHDSFSDSSRRSLARRLSD
jgi:hypothetical protein